MVIGVRRWVVLTVGALALACSSGGPTPVACESDATCPSLSRCIEGACLANGAPVARIAAPPGAVQAFAIASYDAGASFDPDDPLDGVASYEWSVVALDAPCAAPVVAGTTAQAQLRFGCAGRFQVGLVVKDTVGASSAPAAVTVDVAAASGPSAVQVGEDLERAHACAGNPLVCRLVEPAALAASTSGAQGPVTYRWTVEPPPDRALGTGRRVTFDPSPDVASPSVAIETDGLAISGDWLLHVRANDALGVLGTATLRLSVTNSPPSVTATVPVFHHAYNVETSTFSVSNAIDLVVADPEGDPVERFPAWRHSGDGGALFAGLDLGDRLSVEILVPYGQPSDAARLIGAGVERTVDLTVRDVNGAGTVNHWPVVVANRPPSPPAFLAPEPLAHRYVDGQLVASGVVGRWTDPDGDPLLQAGSTGDLACSSVGGPGDGNVVVSCATPYLAPTTLGNFVGAREISVRLRDPWTEPSAARAATITITNRAPLFTIASVTVPMVCGEDESVCCDGEPNACSTYLPTFTGGTTTLSGIAHDPDGDPFTLALRASDGAVASAAATPCAGDGSGCPIDVLLKEFAACNWTSRRVTFVADDGANTATAFAAVEPACQ